MDYSYNQSQRISEILKYAWSLPGGFWRAFERRDYLYNNQGVLSDITGYYSVIDTEDWEISWKVTYTFDQSVGFESLIVPNKLGEYFIDGMLTKRLYYIWDEEKMDWEINEYVDFHYSDAEISNGVKMEETCDHFFVFPNPASDFLNIQMKQNIKSGHAKLIIYSIHGSQEINQKIDSGNNMLNIKELDNGTYIIKLITESGQYFRKFVKM
jgi:hypothetical protein